jgi:hypothetical protein
MAGVNELIERPATGAVTVNEALLVAVPPGVLTVIGLVVAPVGTTIANWLVEAEVTLALVPAKVTESWVAFALNAVPEIETAVPTGPLFGVKSRTET